ELVSPLQEEVLEGKVTLLPEGKPFFLAEFIEFLSELIEETPRLFLFNQLLLQLIIVSECWFLLLEVLTISVDFCYPILQRVPLSPQLFHHFRCFICFLS